MRALAVTPIHLPAEEIRRRQARYDRLAPPGLEVELVDVGAAAPASLDTDESVRASERQVAAALGRAGDGYDLAFPDCVLDPAVPDTVSADPRPVHGLLKLSATYLAGKGVRFGAVVRNEAIAAEFGKRIAELASLGATAVINGCSAVDVEPADLPARIVDPTALALRLLAVEA
ncbi:hydantoin racemase [Amycolatopsis thermoflava]|uniref:hydantoin racemase n=1 Tax=Amycolatopsis thermoflava TaxID=84480 RepID=UPI0038280BC3